MRRVVAGVAGLVVALAGCSNSSGGGLFSAPSAGASGRTSHSSSSQSPTAGTNTTSGLPSNAELTSDLLTASEVGGGFTKIPNNGPTDTDTGCSDLDTAIENGYIKHSGQHEVAAQYGSSNSSAGTIAFVDESLVAESSSLVSADYAQLSRGARTCTHVQDVASQSRLAIDFTLSPISFSSGSVAARMDGTVQGTPVTEYLAATLVKPNVLLLFAYGAYGEQSSSQVALAIFQEAASKAQADNSGAAATSGAGA